LSYARALLEHIGQEKTQESLVIGGFSQGAMLTANLLANLPSQTVGALMFSPADYLTTVPSTDSRRVPLFLSHGTADPILAFTHGIALKGRLEDLGYDLTFVQFEGGHQIPLVVLNGAARFLEERL
jgi:phospholipase/carboxylesterase